MSGLASRGSLNGILCRNQESITTFMLIRNQGCFVKERSAGNPHAPICEGEGVFALPTRPVGTHDPGCECSLKSPLFLLELAGPGRIVGNNFNWRFTRNQRNVNLAVPLFCITTELQRLIRRPHNAQLPFHLWFGAYLTSA